MLELKFKTLFNEKEEFFLGNDDIIKTYDEIKIGRIESFIVNKSFFVDKTDPKMAKTAYILVKDYYENIYMLDYFNCIERGVEHALSSKYIGSVVLKKAIQNKRLIPLTTDNIKNFLYVSSNGREMYAGRRENGKYVSKLGFVKGAGKWNSEVRLFKQIYEYFELPFMIYKVRNGIKHPWWDFYAIFQTDDSSVGRMLEDNIYKKYNRLKEDFENKTGIFAR